jgi:hypothetical protein
MDIAKTAIAAFGQQGALIVLRKVGNDVTSGLVGNDSTYWYTQDHVLATFAVAVGAAPILATFTMKGARVAVIDESIDIAIGDDINRTAASAVASAGAAVRFVFFAPECGCAVTTIPGVHPDGCFIDKFH